LVCKARQNGATTTLQGLNLSLDAVLVEIRRGVREMHATTRQVRLHCTEGFLVIRRQLFDDMPKLIVEQDDLLEGFGNALRRLACHRHENQV
jgi:hypothetical protein